MAFNHLVNCQHCLVARLFIPWLYFTRLFVAASVFLFGVIVGPKDDFAVMDNGPIRVFYSMRATDPSRYNRFFWLVMLLDRVGGLFTFDNNY